MSLMAIIIALIVVGFILWAIQTIPFGIHPWFKNVIMGIVVIAFIIWLLQAFGVVAGIGR